MAKGNGQRGSTSGVSRIQRELPCQLTDSEVQQRGEKLADLETQEAADKATRAVITKRINDRRKDEIGPLVTTIETKQETRLVECEVQRDFTKNVKRTVRLDTKEVVEEVALSAEERQTELEA